MLAFRTMGRRYMDGASHWLRSYMRFLGVRAGVLLTAAALALSVLIAVWPEPGARQLVGADGWSTTGQIGRVELSQTSERAGFVRDSLREGGVLFRTWTPDAGVQPGQVVSPPFHAAPVMAVAISGATVTPAGGAAVYLTCDSHAQRREVFRGSVNDNITEAIVELGPRWCSGQTRLHLESQERYFNVGAGTVAEVSHLTA